MSDLARQEPPDPLDSLARFADVARATHAVAQSLAGTAFVPASMKNKPEEVTGAILAGSEIGLPPMAALASIDLIEGRPAIRANTMRGLLLAAGGEIELVEGNDSRVIMRARLHPSRPWQEITWTIARAKTMGLDTKSNWKKMPQAMLIARATSELVRLVAAHLLIGLPYSTEELTDDGATPVDTAPKAPPRNERTVQRQPVKATVPAPFAEPSLEPEPPAIESTPAVINGEPITDTTRKAIMAGFNELGLRERDKRLANVEAILGRAVPSVNVLTEAEGRRVVRKLQDARTEQSNREPEGVEVPWPDPAAVGS